MCPFELIESSDVITHSEFDDAVLDYASKNVRDRTPLFLCFTPPTATVIMIVLIRKDSMLYFLEVYYANLAL